VWTEEQVYELFESCSNTGRWGEADEAGTLNLITPQKRLAAAALIKDGDVLTLGRHLNSRVRSYGADDPATVVHRMLLHPLWAEDTLSITIHGLDITHMDAVAHHQFEGKVYNGRSASDVILPNGLSACAITVAAEGIFTRGVFLDIAAARGVEWLDPAHGVTVADLEDAEKLAGTTVEPGDAIFIHAGIEAREAAEGPEDYAERPGLLPECIPWLHERGVAVYGGDVIEKLPSPYPNFVLPLHQIGLVAMGLTMLDNPLLTELRQLCISKARYEFALAVAPLKLDGGTGSPINPMCLF
jgi:kynurenine formamidase